MAATATTAAAPPVSHADPKRWTALCFIALAQLMVVLDATIVNIALPSAQRALDISDGDRQWVITAYTLAFGGLLLFGGRIADLLGRKRTFLVGLIGFAGASALGGAAVNADMLFAARALQGMFGALLAPSALSMLAVMFTEPRERAKAFGIYGAIAGGGAAVGLILGGVLTQYLDWRWALYVNVPFAVIAFVGALATVSSALSARHSASLDIPGVVLISGGLVSLVYGFTRAESDGWRDHLTLGAFALAAVLIIAFVIVENVVRVPLLPMRVVLDRNRGGAYLALGLAVIAMFGTFLFLTYYLQTVKGYSPVKSGLAFLPVTAGMITGSTQISARLLHRVPPRVLMVPGLLLAAAGLALLTRLRVDTPYSHLVLPSEILVGLGLGMNMMPSMSLSSLGVEPRDTGIASAMVNTSQQVGGSIGTALLNTIAATAATTYIRDHAQGRPTPLLLATGEVHGFSVALWWGAGALVLAALTAAVFINGGLHHGRHAAAQQDGAPTDGAPAGSAPVEDARAAVPPPRVEDSLPGTARAVLPALAVHGRVRGMEGAGVPRASLTLIDLAGHQADRALSREDGGYTLGAPEPGSYVLIAAAEGHQPQAVSIVVGHEPLACDVALTGTAGLVGTVHAAGGGAVPEATVVVTDARGEVVASTVTGADGRFGVQNLAKGAFTVAVSAQGHRPVAMPVDVAAQDATRCDVELVPATRILGTVCRTGMEQPLDDARVTLVDAEGDVVGEVTTGADGTYAFTDLAPGDYTLVARGYPVTSTRVTLDTGGTSVHDVELGHADH